LQPHGGREFTFCNVGNLFSVLKLKTQGDIVMWRKSIILSDLRKVFWAFVFRFLFLEGCCMMCSVWGVRDCSETFFRTFKEE